MQICNTSDILLSAPCVVALGCFDGVHIGHQRVIEIAREQADRLGVPLTVFTFDEPVKNFFAPDSTPLLCSTEEKLKLFEELGTDITVCVPCDKEILSMPADEFINEILLHRLHAVHAVCGYNYTFGKNASGDTMLLTELCKKNNVGASIVPCLEYKGAAVSSSAIRQALSLGNVEYAAELLGRPFTVSAAVINGQHLARRLGFPTVNTVPDKKHALPSNGVYVTETVFDGKKKYGITNVGIRPTVGTDILCTETHIFDFEGDLYGKTVTVKFLRFLRNEIKFPSIEEMARQIKKDIEHAKSLL